MRKCVSLIINPKRRLKCFQSLTRVRSGERLSHTRVLSQQTAHLFSTHCARFSRPGWQTAGTGSHPTCEVPHGRDTGQGSPAGRLLKTPPCSTAGSEGVWRRDASNGAEHTDASTQWNTPQEYKQCEEGTVCGCVYTPHCCSDKGESSSCPSPVYADQCS